MKTGYRFRFSALAIIVACVLSFSFAQVAFAVPATNALTSGEASLLAMADEGDGEQVVKTSIAGATVSVDKAVYTGAELKPAVSVVVDGVKLSEGVDFTSKYTDNVNAGTAHVTVTGIGDYEGTASKDFDISKAKMSTVAVSVKNQVYTGKTLKPAVVAKLGKKSLAQGKDFKVSYSSNKNAGTATVKLEGKGNMSGTVKASFKIAKANASKFKIAKVSACIYSGKKFEPKPKVTFSDKNLKLGRDYSLSYKANKNAGTAQIIVKGTGNFKGKKITKFKIKPLSLSGASVSKIASKKYTGHEIEPTPTVKLNGKTLKDGIDYFLDYSNNVKAGTAKVTIYGIDNYKGTKRVSFKIWKPAPKPKAASGGGTVYWVPNGSVYHHSRSCRTLKRSRVVHSGTIAQSGKPRACRVCS